DFVSPELGIVVDRSERVLDADRVGLERERALEDRQRFGFLAAVEHGLADDLSKVLRCSRAAQLHLAELCDHLEPTDLAVDLARTRQCFEIVGMELPRALIEPERTFALWDHILDERGQLEETLGLLGLTPRAFQLLLELIDRLRPVARLTQA